MIFNANNSLLNKNVINGFSFGVLFILLLILVLIVSDKHSVFAENKKNISETAVSNVRDAILIAIETKKRTLDNFVENNRSKIISLIKQPDSKTQFDYLFNKLKKQLPDLFTINVYKEGAGLLTDHNDFVGRICKVDLEDYLAVDFHEKRTHPSDVQYHYDEISSLEFGNHRYLFFASFSLDSISNILTHSTSNGHNVMIVNDSDEGFVEILRQGVRNLKDSMKNPTIKSLESDRVLSKVSIPDTHWYVIDVEDDGAGFRNLVSYVAPAAAVYLLIAVIILFMRSVLIRSFTMLSGLNEELINRNKEITALNEDLESLSVTDALTGLHNRRFFDMQYEREWNRATREKQPLYVMIIDIDYFKKYNDHYGHLDGDRCLVKISQVLSSCFCRANEFVTRFGGEEFVAVTSGADNDWVAITECIHNRLKEQNLEHKESVHGRVTVSIGVASYQSGNISNRFLVLKKADEALYQAKTDGRNQSSLLEV